MRASLVFYLLQITLLPPEDNSESTKTRSSPFRLALKIILMIAILPGLAFTFVSIFYCLPIQKIWDMTIVGGRCMDSNLARIIEAAISFLVNILLLFLAGWIAKIKGRRNDDQDGGAGRSKTKIAGSIFALVVGIWYVISFTLEPAMPRRHLTYDASFIQRYNPWHPPTARNSRIDSSC